MDDSDNYVRSVVAGHTPVAAPTLAATMIAALTPHIHAWANGHNYQIKPVGSIAKGTSITGTTDIDLFISLDPSVSDYNTHGNVYQTLHNRFTGAGYTPRQQNVSIGLQHAGMKVDLVAGTKLHALGFDHHIWRRKAQTHTKTNVDEHIRVVSSSGRTEDIRAIKIWRKLNGLDFPSFYLELSVIEALKGNSLTGSPAKHFSEVMTYLGSDFVNKAIYDPANGANKVSDELTDDEKAIVQRAAKNALTGSFADAIW